MRLIKGRLAFILAVLPAAFVAALILVPGPHRILVPGAFGLTEVLPGVYSDAAERTQGFADLLGKADKRTRSFFGGSTPPWRTILCTTAACKADFKIPGRAITIADMAVLTAPSGTNANTLTHELIHIELNARMTPLDAIWPRYPSWFNEGLATHLSGTPPVRGPDRVTDAQWITAAKTPLGWRLAQRGRTPAEYYGAAARMVAGLEAEIGREGLRVLVDAVADGADFSAELARLIGR